ncbi:MAG: peptidase M15 [Paludibacteraceae bacterium]|nr:peptidase M15 [Paludibacteraceae bacterium]
MNAYNLHTKNFTFDELVRSSKAIKAGITNEPESINQLVAICNLMANVLQPAREKCGFPITVTSGFRNERLNKLVGGVAKSQHQKGEAADLRCYSGGKFDAKRTRQLFSILSEMDVDQLLYEKDSQGSIWVHVSYKSPKENRHDVRDNYYAG